MSNGPEAAIEMEQVFAELEDVEVPDLDAYETIRSIWTVNV